jgi:excisionase family DNA binding protein
VVELLTAEDVGQRWGVKPSTVLRLARNRKLPAVRLSRRATRFRPEDVAAFERARLDSGAVDDLVESDDAKASA